MGAGSGRSILWRGFFLPGHEACRLSSRGSGWRLAGTAVFTHDRRACRLNYVIRCDAGWRTLSARVEGWLGDTPVDARIQVDPAGPWLLNGVAQPQ
nr:putative glycolipid-binding domain-containing protein [Anaerolinea sp.]